MIEPTMEELRKEIKRRIEHCRQLAGAQLDELPALNAKIVAYENILRMTFGIGCGEKKEEGHGASRRG